MEELVLLTVGLAHHAPYLRLSHDLLVRSLRGRRWILVDNSADEALRPLARERGFEWVKGAPSPADACTPEQAQSMHHALGLKRGLSVASPRYLLILDPDFFLLAHDALDSLLALMKKRKLAAFGAPWTPELHYKWRDAPCMHCLLLDLNEVPKETLRFEPAENPRANDAMNRAARFTALFQPLRTLLAPLHQLTTGRLGIGQARDTGWEIARQLRRQHAGHIELLPAAVFGRNRFQHPWHLCHGWGWHLERCLPSRWSYLPPADHFRLIKDPVSPEIQSLKLDAFYLDDRIFALHVRRSRSVFCDAGEEAAYVERLSALLQRLAAAAPPAKARA